MIPYLKQIKDEIEKPDNGVFIMVDKRTMEVCEPTPPLNKDAWDRLISLKNKPLSAERIKALRILKERLNASIV